MCVNDLICQGAETLSLSTYVASSGVDEGVLRQVLQGVKQGCVLAGCSLAGESLLPMLEWSVMLLQFSHCCCVDTI